MNLWNIKHLPTPSLNTYKAQDRSIDLDILHTIIPEAIHTLTKPALKKEAAILSRIIYRVKPKFRNDKGFKNMQKMNRALLQMLRLRFTDALKSYLEVIPLKYETDTYLPTLNMLQYILIRLQGLSKLLVRLCEVSKGAAYFMQERIHIAHMWKVSFIMFGIIARVYVLGKELLKFCCEFYGRLLPFSSKFKSVGASWLPETYSLPNDLQAWLDIDWLDKPDFLVKEVTPSVPIFDVDSDSDAEFCDEHIDVEDDTEGVENQLGLSVEDEDIGEPVESKEIPKMPRQSMSSNYIITRLNTFKDLKQLARNFVKMKSEHPKVFKNIDKLQFNMLHTLIKKNVTKAKRRPTDNVINKCLLDVKDALMLQLLPAQ